MWQIFDSMRLQSNYSLTTGCTDLLTSLWVETILVIDMETALKCCHEVGLYGVVYLQTIELILPTSPQI